MVVYISLADLFLEFLLHYKGAANFKTDKTQICAYDFKSFSDRNSSHLLERTLADDSTAIWHFLWHKCKMFFLAVCYFLAGFTPQSRFFGCTIPWWCSQNLHFKNHNVLFAFKRLDFDFRGFFNLLEWPIPVFMCNCICVCVCLVTTFGCAFFLSK